jgi:DNA-binding beta-propeller fold protein YncE
MRLVRLLPRLFVLAIAAVTLGPPIASAQSIVPIAGTGVEGFNGDGSPATTKQLAFPFGVAVDAAGTVCVADRNNHRVRCISGGTMTTVAGTGVAGYNGENIPASTARLNSPTGVAFDSAGNLFIADAGNHIVRKVTAPLSTGAVSTVAGIPQKLGPAVNGGLATAATLFDPRAVAVSASGDIYIADRMNQQIRRVNAATGIIGAVAGVAGQTGSSGDGGLATAARLNSPQGIALDAFGSVYIADEGNNKIRQVFNPSCDGPCPGPLIRTLAGTGDACEPDPEAYGPTCGDGGKAIEAQLNAPTGVAVDASSGDVYIADVNTGRIRRVFEYCSEYYEYGGCALNIETFAGGFTAPVAVAVRADAYVFELYVSDVQDHTVSRVGFGE